jgi:hypothetical protein
MSDLDFLSLQLRRYKRLRFHHNPAIAQKMREVQQWHIARLKNSHQELFSHPKNQKLMSFLLERFYNTENIETLASQLNKLFHEKVKFESFLPKPVLSTAVLGLSLAFITLRLDEDIAVYCLEQQKEKISTDVMFDAIIQLNQFKWRNNQLIFLNKTVKEMQNFERSWLTQSAFRLAKRTAYRRGFAPLYDYLDECFSVIKHSPQLEVVLGAFIRHEKVFLSRLQKRSDQPSRATEETEPTSG